MRSRRGMRRGAVCCMTPSMSRKPVRGTIAKVDWQGAIAACIAVLTSSIAGTAAHSNSCSMSCLMSGSLLIIRKQVSYFQSMTICS